MNFVGQRQQCGDNKHHGQATQNQAGKDVSTFTTVTITDGRQDCSSQ